MLGQCQISTGKREEHIGACILQPPVTVMLVTVSEFYKSLAGETSGKCVYIFETLNSFGNIGPKVLELTAKKDFASHIATVALEVYSRKAVSI